MNNAITTKKDLKDCLACDISNYERVSSFYKRFVQTFSSNPVNFQNDTWKYIYCLRHSEYHYNNSVKYKQMGGISLLHSILCSYYFYRLRRLSYKTGFQIPPNTIGRGLQIYHYGAIIVNPNARIGEHATLYPGVVIGHKGDGSRPPIIGNNVFIGSGAKVIGPITIGDNVTIAPNAVVVNDVPDNAIVAGVPAIVKRIKK